MLHYKSEDWYVGDVHPYYYDNKLYLFYLKPNGITRCDACFEDPTKVVCGNSVVAVTDNYCDYTETELNVPVVNIVKVGETFITKVGEGSCVESTDLLHWEKTDKFTLSLDRALFPAGSRDYALFYDDDLGGVRSTMLAYFTNEHWKEGRDLDCAVGISGVIPLEGEEQVPQKVLFPLNNKGKNLMKSPEPECNQMLKIGSRWYLLTSLARQTVHWVGPLSYWIGNENTPIDQDNFAHKKEYRLDGEDLSAAQVASFGDRFYKFGWIPMNYDGQEWGGHLNLPHEVYQLPNGELGCRLDPEYAKSIKKNEKSHEIFYNEYVQPFGRSIFVDVKKDFGIRTCLDLEKSEKAGLILDRAKGIAVVLDRATKQMRVVREDGNISFCFSSLELHDDVWSSTATIHAIYDDDIVEVFLNDRYTLCARTDSFNSGNTAGVFCDREIRWIRSYELTVPDSSYKISN